MMSLRLAAALLAVTCVYSPPAQTAQTPTPEAIVAKASAYVHEFVRRFANVVAEERYQQEITVPRRKRLLTSDFLLVRYPGDELWQAFRDVSEVDGKPVGDRENRIMKLFTQPSDNALRRATELANASTRHNLLNVGTLSNPMLAIAFLQDQYYARFRFNLAGIDKKLGPDVRTVRFVEFQTPSLIKGNSNSDIMSRGLFWIEEGSGRVVKTELQLGSTAAPIRIITTFKFDEDLGINVPATMEDWYPDGTGEFRGKATYGKFRRFQVQTEETVAAPKP
jgi:hypothetical protein